jgi:hypothetical protein
MPCTLEATQLLDVEVQQVAWPLVLVADHWLGRFKTLQPAQAMSRADTTHRRNAHLGQLCDAPHREPFATQPEDRSFLRGDSSW